jgi:hypothetical protein
MGGILSRVVTDVKLINSKGFPRCPPKTELTLTFQTEHHLRCVYSDSSSSYDAEIYNAWTCT